MAIDENISEKEKEHKTEEKFIKICPKCHSENTSPDFSNIAGINFGALNSWRCMRCGYVADRALFPEIPESEKPPLIDMADIKKDYPVVDISIGKFFTKFGKIFGPLGLLLCLYLIITSSFLAYFYLLFVPIFVYIILYSYSKKCRKNERFRKTGFFVFLYWIVLMFLYFV